MYECLVCRAGGGAARLPQHRATVVLGLYDVRDLLGREDPAFADRVARYFEYCRENDRSIATVFSDPLHHRNHPVSKYNVGSLATNKQRLASTYDTSACVALARELAGITGPAARSGG